MNFDESWKGCGKIYKPLQTNFYSKKVVLNYKQEKNAVVCVFKSDQI